jgi:DNA polymerase elongation subunit (family B)
MEPPVLFHHWHFRRCDVELEDVERLIAKRCELKKLLKTTAPDTALRFKLQRDSMKWLLVCCFGYTGYKNASFGKIEAHEAINAVARETLLVAKEIAEADGFELIHALVDSLYVWKEGATREHYERLSQEIENRTRLPLFAADSCLRDPPPARCVLPFVAEHFYVFGAFFYGAAGAALHLYADLLDDIRVGEGRDVAGVHLIGNGG